ncbi:MAG: hypothetical protein HRJ53_08910, partial [Acidobacteria bacterium Pan2503]|nr:hypothetical protein [Candidatus Acidoferrum panamensis]
VQNNRVNAAVNTAGFSETNVWSGMVGQCGNPNSPVGVVNTCYPPAVNYTPFYYLINGLAFNKTNPAVSVFHPTAGVTATTPPTPVVTGITGTVLVRLVNAGLRMHVPSIVGSQTTGFTGAGVLTTAAAPVQGFTLIAEDGNVIPNVAPPGATTAPAAPRVQTDVFMASGKVFDVLINAVNVPAITTALPVYDRSLSLSGNSSARDAGMLAYIGVNGSGLPVTAGSGIFAAAVARADTYNSLVPSQAFTVSDPSKGVIANDTNVYGVHLFSGPTSGTLSCPAQPQNPTPGICANGTFTYTPTGTGTSDSFVYCANGAVTTTGTTSTCSSGLTATVTLGPATVEGASGITCSFPAPAYTAKTATYLKVPSPGVLAFCRDAAGYPLKIAATPAPTLSGGTVLMDANGGFNATLTAAGTATTTASLTFSPQNSQGTVGGSQTAMISFPVPSNLSVNVLDAQAYNNCVTSNANANPSTCIASIPTISDYRWIIEEDRTFWVDPNCTTNTGATAPAPGCPTLVGPSGTSTIPTFAVNFHTSTMPYVAQGCTGPLSCESGQTMLDTRPACIGTPAPAGCSATAGQHIPAVCDLGNGACRPDPNCTALPCLTAGGSTPVLPSSVHLDPTKRYYISVLPGDAGNPFPSNVSPPTGCLSGGVVGGALNTGCGHTMSGAPIPPACNVLVAGCTPTSTAAFAPVTVLTLPTPLPTGKLSVLVFEDDFPLNGEQDGGGGNGVSVAPVEPGLGGFNIVLWDTYGGLGDVTGQNSYDMFNQPLSNALTGTIDPATGLDACPISAQATTDPTQKGITGMIVTCPKYEADGATLSPLAGQAVIANLMPEKFSVQAYPGADRIARGEEWLQTNTLDGQHPHDSFIRIGEPSYFQEYGPAGYHVSIGFANPAIINARREA